MLSTRRNWSWLGNQSHSQFFFSIKIVRGTWCSTRISLPCFEGLIFLHSRSLLQFALNWSNLYGNQCEVLHLEDETFLRACCRKVVTRTQLWTWATRQPTTFGLRELRRSSSIGRTPRFHNQCMHDNVWWIFLHGIQAPNVFTCSRILLRTCDCICTSTSKHKTQLLGSSCRKKYMLDLHPVHIKASHLQWSFGVWQQHGGIP